METVVRTTSISQALVLAAAFLTMWVLRLRTSCLVQRLADISDQREMFCAFTDRHW